MSSYRAKLKVKKIINSPSPYWLLFRPTNKRTFVLVFHINNRYFNRVHIELGEFGNSPPITNKKLNMAINMLKELMVYVQI